MNLKNWCQQNKTILIICCSILTLLILFIIIGFKLFKTNNTTSTDIVYQQEPAKNNDSNLANDNSNSIQNTPQIIEITIESDNENEIKNEIQDFILNNVGNRDFDKNPYCGFNPPLYNIIDKTVKAYGPDGAPKIIQHGMFICPVKNPPTGLLAVYFEGGTKRGGDEEDNEEDETIPKYDLNDLKKMHNGATKIYVFNKNRPIL